MYLSFNTVTYFDSFGVEHVLKKIKKLIKGFTITTNIYRVKAFDSTIYGYFCVGFIDFMLNGKNLTDFTNLFSLNNFKDNNKIILKYIKNKWSA